MSHPWAGVREWLLHVFGFRSMTGGDPEWRMAYRHRW